MTSYINLVNLMIAKHDVINPINLAWPQSNIFAIKRFANPEPPTMKADLALIDFSDRIVGSIFDWRQFLDVAAGTEPITTARDLHTQRLMRPFVVVYIPPLVKPLLTVRYTQLATVLQYLCLKSSMKSFILTHRLRMVRSAMDYCNADPHQPYRQAGITKIRICTAPGRSIVHEKPLWHSEPAKDHNELISNRLIPLITAGLDPYRVSRMIVQHCQRMATTVSNRHMPFKVHLPKIVGRFSFKPLPSLMFTRFSRIKQAPAPQNVCDRAWSRNSLPAEILKPFADLAPAPRTVALPDSNDGSLHFFRCIYRNRFWPTRSIGYANFAFGTKTFNPFIPGLTTDIKTAAKFTDVSTLCRGQR